MEGCFDTLSFYEFIKFIAQEKGGGKHHDRERNEPQRTIKGEHNRRILRLFDYGTLKRGFWNYDRFCRSVLPVEKVVVRGRLYEILPRIPILQIPEEEDILAHGTTDPMADVGTQAHLPDQVALPPRSNIGQIRKTADLDVHKARPEGASHGRRASKRHTGQLGLCVRGTLTFDDPESRLSAIDRLEGFHPGGSSLYKRVLVPACISGQISPEWVYVVAPKHRAWKFLSKGIWPE